MQCAIPSSSKDYPKARESFQEDLGGHPKAEGDVGKTINIASDFFAEFLFINPFSDGNDQVARVLLSIILSCVSSLPIFLCLPTSESRDLYHRSIFEAQFLSPPNKTGLAMLILESMASGIRSVVLALELSEENGVDESQ
jgi:hypothetical protein